jgi:glycosyltransferase involved in cell wall biosynthesis
MNRKINLLQITHDLAIGGLQQVVVNLCKSIDRSRFNITVLCLRALGEFAPEVERCGIPVLLLPQGQKTDYFSFLKVAKIMRERHIDVIHTHNTQPFFDGVIGGLMAGVKTMVHTDHARSFPDKRRYMFAEWVLSHFAHKVVGVSDHTSDNLVRYEHISRKKIVTIPNGIVGTRFRQPIDVEAKRRELGIPPTGPVIGIGARLTEQKGITYLLKALPTVLAQHPSLTVIVAGNGPLLPDLKGEAAALGLEQRVRFVGPRTDMPEIIRLFDIYVLPSLWEGLPIVLLEAMAAGCPIVATRVGGNAVAVSEGRNGLLVPPADPPALAKALSDLLSDAALRQRMSAVGQAMFDRDFSADEMTRKYEALYLRQTLDVPVRNDAALRVPAK